jgi:hypothetical protein
MTADGRKSKWFLYPGWVVLSTLGILIAWLTSWAIISQIEHVVGGTIEVAGRARITEDFMLGYVFFPLFALLTGLLQYLLLRHYLSRMGWWIATPALGWLLGIAVVYLGYAIWPVVLNARSTWWAVLVFASIGATTGLVQWLVLRRRVPRAGWWVLASVLGWGLVRPVSGESFTSPPELLLGLGVVPSAVTGLALWWLLAHLPQPEIAASEIDGGEIRGPYAQ